MILEKNNPKTLTTLISLMHEGKAAVVPCDTIYGLSAIYGKGENVLRKIKERDKIKSFLILATAEQVKDLCTDIPDEIAKLWPCNLTTVLKLKSGGTIAVRVPDDEFLQNFLSKLGSPVYSTSVNISGTPSLLDFSSIQKAFEDKVSLLVKAGEIQGTTPSTIIDATQRPFKLLRQGSFDATSIIEKSEKR